MSNETMMLDCHEGFTETYKRVSKLKGEKLIRCFPACRPKGHRGNGFCGSTLTLTLPCDGLRVGVDYWGRVGRLHSELVDGKVVPVKYFSDNQRTADNPYNEWLKGRVVSMNPKEVIVVFNELLLGWYYNWTSHKNTSDTPHFFIVFQCWNSETSLSLAVQHIHSSKAFRLYSRSATSINSNDCITRQRPREPQNSILPDSNPQPASADHVKNRTLDRLYLYFISGIKNSYEIKNYEYQSFDQFVQTKMKVIDITMFKRLDNVKATFASLMSDNQETNDCIVKCLSNPDMFKKQSWKELETPFVWSEKMEDETFDEENGSEVSLYGKFRQIYRNNTSLALDLCQEEIASFHEIMTIASAFGFFQLDPFYPPSSNTARGISVQLYSGSKSCDFSIDLPAFKNRASQESYAHDLLLFRRSTYQSAVYERMKAFIPHFLLTTVQDPRIDVNGIWVEGDTGKKSTFPGVLDAMLGEAESTDFRQLFSKVCVRVTSTSLVARAQSVSINTEYVFDAEVHDMSVPFIPTAFSNESKYLETTSESAKYLAYVDIIDELSGSIHVARDYRIHPPKDFVRYAYPELFANEPAERYKWIGFVDLKRNTSMPNILQFGFVDYLVPVTFEMNFESIKQLRKRHRYLVSNNVNTYYRHIVESRMEEERTWNLDACMPYFN